MDFNQNEVDKLLAECHRRCCVCHKFCGFKMEVHHIQPELQNGSNDIGNAIPLCFECHAEVLCYNPEHPKGRKYTKNELLNHKEQWLTLCREKPEILVGLRGDRDIGPLWGMVLELEYNLKAAKLAEGPSPQKRIGASLKSSQYEKAISEGAIMLLSDEVKEKITTAYLEIIRANNFNSTRISIGPIGSAYEQAGDDLANTLKDSISLIEEALNFLKKFLNLNKNQSSDTN